MSVAKEMGNLSSEFKRCIVFRFRVNGEHGRTDGRTDGHDVTRNAAS